MTAERRRTQVAIIGGGPAGMLLSHVLSLNGIDSIVLERRSREHVQGRIRAGVLETGSARFLRDVGLGANMDHHGHRHDGVSIAWQDKPEFLIDTKRHVGLSMIAYGQTALTADLYAVREAAGAEIRDHVADVRLHDLTTHRPGVDCVHRGRPLTIDCDFIAGCDGFHGVSRRSIPDRVRQDYERVYPFGWLGVLAEVPPLDRFIYARHERGFALAAQRSPSLSRYYIQVPSGTTTGEWPDDRFWRELVRRFPDPMSTAIEAGPTIEKSIAPLRSFVSEPMRYGRLFLCGDSAHIVPPTGAKGLNLAISDVFYLARALDWHYRKQDDGYLDCYSETALRRVWGATRISWWLTWLLHRFPDRSAFDDRLSENEYDHLLASEHAQRWLCEQYAGLPYEA